MSQVLPTVGRPTYTSYLIVHKTFTDKQGGDRFAHAFVEALVKPEVEIFDAKSSKSRSAMSGEQ